MAVAIAANSLGTKLIKVLGLPKNTYEFTIRFRAGELVIIECRSYFDDENGERLVEELSRFEAREGGNGDLWLMRRMDSPIIEDE